MLHKRITTKAQAAKIAKELAQDIEKETSYFNGYEVEVLHDNDGYYIKFSTNDDYFSLIITATAGAHVHKVIDTYIELYEGIDYHYGVSGTKNGQYKPTICINVNISK